MASFFSLLDGPEFEERSDFITRLTDIAQERGKRYEDLYRPVEGRFRETADRIGGPAEKAREAGKATAAVRTHAGLRRPDSVTDIIGQESGLRRGLTRASNQSDFKAEQRGNRAQESVINLGRDVENLGTAGLKRSLGLEDSTRQTQMEMDRMGRGNESELIGAGLGYGLSRWGDRNNSSNNSSGMDAFSPESASDYDFWRTA